MYIYIYIYIVFFLYRFNIYIHFMQVGDLENMYKFNFEGDESEMSKMADELEKDEKVINFSSVPGCCAYVV